MRVRARDFWICAGEWNTLKSSAAKENMECSMSWKKAGETGKEVWGLPSSGKLTTMLIYFIYKYNLYLKTCT